MHYCVVQPPTLYKQKNYFRNLQTMEFYFVDRCKTIFLKILRHRLSLYQDM